MMAGEIVRAGSGLARFVRIAEGQCDEMDAHAVILENGQERGWYLPLSVVTVSELFEAAGHPVPGDRMAFVFSLEYTNALVSIGPRQWLSCSFSQGTGYWQFTNGEWVRIDKPINEDGTSVCDDDGQEVEGDWCIAYSATLSLGNNASRMPALDAWDNLPDEIKAVVR